MRVELELVARDELELGVSLTLFFVLRTDSLEPLRAWLLEVTVAVLEAAFDDETVAVDEAEVELSAGVLIGRLMPVNGFLNLLAAALKPLGEILKSRMRRHRPDEALSAGDDD